MLARVESWEGGSAEAIRTASEDIRARMRSGPPDGVKSAGFTMLVDPDAGRTLMIGLFDSEDDLRASEPALEAMSAPEGIGRRAAVDIYTVVGEVRA